MPQAAAPAALRHLPQEVVQAAQPSRRRRLGRRRGPGRRRRRRLVQAAQRLQSAGRQRPGEHPLRPPVRHPFAMRLRVAPRLAQLDPVRRPVARPLEARRIHERLRHQRRMPQRRLHVRRQAPHRQRQRPRRQVPHTRVRQNQKPRVVRHQPQTPELLLRRPADPSVPRLHLERPALPAHERQPAPVRRLGNMPHPAAEQTPEAQVVVRVHQTIPLRPLRAASHRTHQHLRQRHADRLRTRCHDLSASSATEPMLNLPTANVQRVLFPLSTQRLVADFRIALSSPHNDLTVTRGRARMAIRWRIGRLAPTRGGCRRLGSRSKVMG